jgi:hypothetical protein
MIKFISNLPGVVYVLLLMIISFGPMAGLAIFGSNMNILSVAAIMGIAFCLTIIIDLLVVREKEKDPNYDPWTEI